MITVLLSLVTSGLVAHRNEQIRTLEERASIVREKIDELEMLVDLGSTQQDHLSRLRAATHNLPSLFLLHLSQLAPAEVVFTEVVVDQAASGWTVSLQGTVAGDLRHSARTMAGFEADLEAPPWSLEVTKSFRETWMEQFNQGKSDADASSGFQIVGVMP